MRKNGAQIAVNALEQLGVKYTFGIPGTHTTELYDALRLSKKIEPILVSHESGGSFMADAVSRTSDSIGCLTIVPAAGLAYAMSGIGEAFLAGIPMLVITGGVRRDSGRHYQLHQVDQQKMAAAITKAQFLVREHAEITPMIFEAYRIATTGEPGPVLVEIPVEIMLFAKTIRRPKKLEVVAKGWDDRESQIPDSTVTNLVGKLVGAKHPMIFAGWGATGATDYLVKIAEKLQAPVAVTLQGKSAFPNDHPLYAGCFLGAGSKPGSQLALKKHDVLLAVGCRFSEISTASYNLDNPRGLIHIDINAEVFNKNFPAEITVESDARVALEGIWNRMENIVVRNDNKSVVQKMIALNKKYDQGWLKEKKKDVVSPGWFFESLNGMLDPDDVVVLDDGKHTFLAAELLTVRKPRKLISPTDFNCMGYCIPAAVAAKLTNPHRNVVGIVGDGSAIMSGNELISATTLDLSPIVFIFNDGELGQIAAFQKLPLGEKTCTVLGDFNFEGLAKATGAIYFRLDSDTELRKGMRQAFRAAEGNRPVLVDVRIDYSKKTMLTKAVMKGNLARFPAMQKLRFVRRSVARNLGKPKK